MRGAVGALIHPHPSLLPSREKGYSANLRLIFLGNFLYPSVSYPVKVNPTLEVEHESGIKEGNKACRLGLVFSVSSGSGDIAQGFWGGDGIYYAKAGHDISGQRPGG